MHRFLLILPLSACMHTPCPVPLSCVTPDDCVCLVTGTVDAPRGGGGGQGYTPDAPDAPAPDAPDNGGNGGHSNGGSSDGGSDDSNGDNSHE